MQFSEVRVRTKISEADLERKKGKIVGPLDIDIMLVGPTIVKDSAGTLLAIYLPGVLKGEVLEGSYDVLHELRTNVSSNRGLASGGTREKRYAEGGVTYAPNVASAIIGSFDPSGQFRYCRLTAWSGREWEKYSSLFPLFQLIGKHFADNVPDRWGAQMKQVRATHPDWIIEGTPFTTITVNNSYPTGVHTDKGDLDEGFSTLAVLRRGNYTGGLFTFVENRVAVDMQHGDLLLMDAHHWHGNTDMTCGVCGEAMGGYRSGAPHKDHSEDCGAERISIVSYFRTKLTDCGSQEEEQARAVEQTEKQGKVFTSLADRTLEEMAVEARG